MLLSHMPMRSASTTSTTASVRSAAMPISRLVMEACSLEACSLAACPSWGRHQPITDAAHGLDEQRVGGIALDLAPQTVDLNVDRALADGAAIAGERESRHRLARACRQHPHHFALAIGETYVLLAAAQLAARK